MQITFNVPDALMRDVEWLAAKQHASADALLYITAFYGFAKELERKVAEEHQREAAEQPFRRAPAPIDWHGKDRPAPINWKGGVQ